jgi:hypothetical protein
VARWFRRRYIRVSGFPRGWISSARHAPFPLPARQTGRARSRHPTFRRDSPSGPRGNHCLFAAAARAVRNPHKKLIPVIARAVNDLFPLPGVDKSENLRGIDVQFPFQSSVVLLRAGKISLLGDAPQELICREQMKQTASHGRISKSVPCVVKVPAL